MMPCGQDEANDQPQLPIPIFSPHHPSLSPSPWLPRLAMIIPLAKRIGLRATSAVPPTASSQATNSGSVPIAVIILLPILAILSFYCLRRWSRRTEPPILRAMPLRPPLVINPPICLTQADVDALRMVKYSAPRHKAHLFRAVSKETTAMAEQQGCAVCTEAFREAEKLRKLPCSHLFHPSCIDPWLLKRAVTCPLWYVPRSSLVS